MTKRKPAPGQMPFDFWREKAQDDYWLQLAEREAAQATQAEQTRQETAAERAQAAQWISTVTGLTYEQADSVLQKAGGLFKLAQLPEYALQALPHIGPEQAKQIRAMTAWAQQLHSTRELTGVQIKTPLDIANLLMLEMGLLDKEELRVVGLDRQNIVAGSETVYRGSVDEISIRVAEVLRLPIALQCCSMVICHNHPSGDPSPSRADERVTELVRDTAQRLSIDLLDHLVIGRNRFVSLREKGLGF